MDLTAPGDAGEQCRRCALDCEALCEDARVGRSAAEDPPWRPLSAWGTHHMGRKGGKGASIKHTPQTNSPEFLEDSL
eukprot:14785924-Heterocapsa_arctica.AAC.1